MAKKEDPILEDFTRWLTENWSHMGLVISILIIVGLVIALALVRR